MLPLLPLVAFTPDPHPPPLVAPVTKYSSGAPTLMPMCLQHKCGRAQVTARFPSLHRYWQHLEVTNNMYSGLYPLYIPVYMPLHPFVDDMCENIREEKANTCLPDYPSIAIIPKDMQ